MSRLRRLRRLRSSWRSLAREESGFTLVELMVSMSMMLLVTFALYAIFGTSVRIFETGNHRTEALENARLGLERMSRELRAAYPADLTTDPPQEHLFSGSNASSQSAMPGADRITFANDRNGDRRITCENSRDCEYITYRLTTSGSTRALIRDTGTGGRGTAVVENVVPNGLNFTYLSRTDPETVATEEAEVRFVGVELTVRVGDEEHTLSNVVALRNRGG